MNEFFDVLNEKGEYTNKIASRDECHHKGLWHKVVVIFILSSDNKKVLLQQRSSKLNLWPNLWDITAGGHVKAGEFGYQAVIRETKEEIGVDITKDSLEFTNFLISEEKINQNINRHFVEFYIVHKDVNPKEVLFNQEEISELKWFDIQEVINRINNNYEGITKGYWQHLLKYIEMSK